MKTLIVSYLPYDPVQTVGADYIPVYQSGRNPAGYTHNILTDADLPEVVADPTLFIPVGEEFIGARSL